MKEQTNIILRNLYLHDPPEPNDLIELQYSTPVWIDHCDLSMEGITGDKDYYDGFLDATRVCENKLKHGGLRVKAKERQL